MAVSEGSVIRVAPAGVRALRNTSDAEMVMMCIQYKVRPMQYMILDDGKLWFCTNSEKDVYKELQANPSLELCGCKLEENEIQTPWIRFSAEAVFKERQDIRDAIIEKSSIVNALYSKMRENPIFKVFYLKNIDGWMTNLGNVKGLEKRTEFAEPIHFEF